MDYLWLFVMVYCVLKQELFEIIYFWIIEIIVLDYLF